MLRALNKFKQADTESCYTFGKINTAKTLILSTCKIVNVYVFPSVAAALENICVLSGYKLYNRMYFQSPRRVKSLLRLTMGGDRPSGLCIISVYREQVNPEKGQFIGKPLTQFGHIDYNLHLMKSITMK